ncbi:MAG: hypothetical protein ACK526_10645 [Planctomyces sp.]|jgi:hypothetical protein
MPKSAEQELAEAIRHQTNVFSASIEIINRIHDQENLEDPSSMKTITQLQRSLEQVTSAQSRVTEARQRTEKTGQKLSPMLIRELEQHEVSMRHLLEKIASVEQRFEAARSALIPQLDDETRRQNMRTAYQQSLRTV